jgi:diaminohydroxyphosphoribosylaminopyrimidine deaminase/5-amino-6-(5-phosphoribosylamino)uracil reductase
LLSKKDLNYLNSVNNLSIKNLGLTGINPSVACLIVDFKNNSRGIVLSYGLTSHSGRPHAEINALNKISNSRINNQTTLYVSLEPCFKENSCCAKKIVSKGIKRVVIASLDPNPQIHGKGVKFLKSQGIQVILAGPKQNIFKKINKYFYYFQKKNLPYITLKIAVSHNYYAKSLISKNITLNETQHYMHKLRLKHDAIVVGFNTYKDDRPKLNCRLNGIDKKIIPYVLTNELNKKIKFPQIVFKNNTHFDNFFSILNKKPVQSVLIEGGLQTFKKFLINRVFNEVIICQSSKSIKKSKKRYKLDKKLIESRCKKMNSQIYLKDKIDTYLNV